MRGGREGEGEEGRRGTSVVEMVDSE